MRTARSCISSAVSCCTQVESKNSEIAECSIGGYGTNWRHTSPQLPPAQQLCLLETVDMWDSITCWTLLFGGLLLEAFFTDVR
jgi:hypothetical protein